jgi:hypothetical protein
MIPFRCGNGMTFDIDNSRCDLSKNIDCKNGERPSWIPPSECMPRIYISLTIKLIN